MSYILDAIKKSEQQRQQTEVPSLYTLQISNEKKRPSFLLYSVVAAILICAGILIGWLGTWRQGNMDLVTEHILSKKNESNLAQSQTLRPPRLAHESSRKSELKPQVINPSTTKMVSKADTGALESAQDEKIFVLEELPLSIRQEIPKMSISGYAYSNIAKERTVGINDRLLQEGEYVTQGLKLERIGPDGLEFSYKNYHFRQSL